MSGAKYLSVLALDAAKLVDVKVKRRPTEAHPSVGR